MNKPRITPNTTHSATTDEIRASMLHWWADNMTDYTVEQWQTFKASLYPDPAPLPEDDPDPVPDFEGLWEERHGNPAPWRM